MVGPLMDLDKLIPNVLEACRQVDHDDGCPEDDTCECDAIQAINAELGVIAAELGELERRRTNRAGEPPEKKTFGRLTTDPPLVVLQRRYDELVSAVREMRDAQKTYFKTKSGAALEASKKLERQLDKKLVPPERQAEIDFE